MSIYFQTQEKEEYHVNYFSYTIGTELEQGVSIILEDTSSIILSKEDTKELIDSLTLLYNKMK